MCLTVLARFLTNHISELHQFPIKLQFFLHGTLPPCVQAPQACVILFYSLAKTFIHNDDGICIVYMIFFFIQVYVRRAYIAYELNSVQHRQLKDNTCVVEFQFMLPTSHPNRLVLHFLKSLTILVNFDVQAVS